MKIFCIYFGSSRNALDDRQIKKRDKNNSHFLSTDNNASWSLQMWDALIKKLLVKWKIFVHKNLLKNANLTLLLQKTFKQKYFFNFFISNLFVNCVVWLLSCIQFFYITVILVLFGVKKQTIINIITITIIISTVQQQTSFVKSSPLSLYWKINKQIDSKA